METLIALGTFASMVMAIYLSIINSINVATNSNDNMTNMMEVATMLETACLILTIINLGKFLEGKAKAKIL